MFLQSIYRNNLTSDLDDPSIGVSSESEDDDESENSEGRFSMKIARKNYQIFSRFFCFAKTFDYPDDNDYNYILNSFCALNNFSELCFRSRLKRFRDSLGQNDKSKKIEISAWTDSLANVSNPSKIKLRAPKNDSAFERKNVRPIRTTSSDQTKGSRIVINYSSTRMQKINPGCLLEKVTAKNRRNKRTNKENPTPLTKEKLKVKPIICEMYGTRTFNYDNIEPELPPGVKSTNLSDSSVSSVFYQIDSIKPDISNSFELPNANFNVDLSSASSASSTSSSSTCSCSTCCSTSSDTSSTTSSKSNSASKRE